MVDLNPRRLGAAELQLLLPIELRLYHCKSLPTQADERNLLKRLPRSCRPKSSSPLTVQLDFDVPVIYHPNNSFDVIHMLEEIQVLDHLRITHQNLLRSLRPTDALGSVSEPLQTEPA